MNISENLAFIESRDLERKSLIDYPDVCELISEEYLGKLADITTEGIMLITDRKLPVDSAWELMIKLQGDADREEIIHFKARCRWCRPDINSEHYTCGFQFSLISLQGKYKIEDLIRSSTF